MVRVPCNMLRHPASTSPSTASCCAWQGVYNDSVSRHTDPASPSHAAPHSSSDYYNDYYDAESPTTPDSLDNTTYTDYTEHQCVSVCDDSVAHVAHMAQVHMSEVSNKVLGMDFFCHWVCTWIGQPKACVYPRTQLLMAQYLWARVSSWIPGEKCTCSHCSRVLNYQNPPNMPIGQVYALD